MVTEAIKCQVGEMKTDGIPSERAQNRESIMQAIKDIKQNREVGGKLSVRNAATRYGVSKSTLHRYLAKGERNVSSGEGGSDGGGGVDTDKFLLVLETPEGEKKAASSGGETKSEADASASGSTAPKPPAKELIAKTTVKPPVVQTAPPAKRTKTKQGMTEIAPPSSAIKSTESPNEEKKVEGEGIELLVAASNFAGTSKKEAGQKRPRSATEPTKESKDPTSAGARKTDKAQKLQSKTSKEAIKATGVSIHSLEKDLGELEVEVRELETRVKKLEEENTKSNAKQIELATTS